MAEVDAGFEIKGTFFPQPVSFRLMDTILVHDVTGMKMDEFSKGLEEESWDERSIVGLVAVAVSQKNRTWGRQRVLDYLNDINWDDLTPIGIEQEANGGPPVEEAQETPLGQVKSDEPSQTSESEQDSTSESSSQMSSGTPPLDTGPE